MCIRDRGCVIELEGRLRGDSQDGKTSNGALNPEGFAAHPGSDVFAHVLEQVADAIMVMDAQVRIIYVNPAYERLIGCLLYTSDAADDLLCVDLGGRRIIKKKKHKT